MAASTEEKSSCTLSFSESAAEAGVGGEGRALRCRPSGDAARICFFWMCLRDGVVPSDEGVVDRFLFCVEEERGGEEHSPGLLADVPMLFG